MAADYPEAYAARGEKPITAGGIPVEVENNSGSTAPAPSEPQPSDTPETDSVHYGCALYESDVERYRDMAEHARQLERELNAAVDRERLANMRADQAEEAREAAQEVAGRETLKANYWKDKASAVSATPTISGIPLVKMFRDQRDQLADALRHVLWIKDCGVDGRDENGVFRNFPESERDAMYNIAKDALKDVPSYVQQLRNVADGIGMDYDELVRRLSSSAPSDNRSADKGQG